MSTNDRIYNRRQFLRQSACASLGLTGLVSTLAHLRLMQASLACQTPLPDYRAMVCLFLFGGIDSNNILIPANGHPARADYDSGRGVLAIPDSSLIDIFPDNTGDPYGLHPNLQSMADLFNAGELAFVNNTGSLSYPIPDRCAYLNGAVPVPPQLFSHSDQQIQWQSSIPDKPFQSGWGGRISELLNASCNPMSEVSMSISLAGSNSFQVGPGGSVVQYAVTPTGAVSLVGYGNNYENALNPDGSYKTNNAGMRLKAFEEIMNYTHSHLLEEGYDTVVRRARDQEGVIGDAIQAADNSGVDFDTVFFNAQTPMGDQLKMIAKLIAGRDCLGNQRQIYFCSMGGYDTHQDQNNDLNNLCDELGNALKAFSDAMIALGVNDDVLTCTNSDFTRTLTPNGTDPNSSGSDHGWGGHQIAMGGPVFGKNLYGTFPSLKVGDDDDVDNSRGRWIPSTAVDQYAAVCAKWIGVDSSSMDAIFPNLHRFDDPFSSGPNLQFVDLT